MQGGIPPSATERVRVTGPGASAFKYDILTALLALAAQGDPVDGRLALRLSLLITARYNWRQGTFTVGQRELARMWGVTERTAKREVAAMRQRGWLVVAIPAARGRVATYRLEMPLILRATMPHWESVGPDFVARMTGAPEQAPSGNVVPLRTAAEPAIPEADAYGWQEAAIALRAQDPSVYDAWFAGLRPLEIDGGVLSLSAPSQFVADYVRTHFKTRLLAVMVARNRSLRDIAFVSD